LKTVFLHITFYIYKQAWSKPVPCYTFTGYDKQRTRRKHCWCYGEKLDYTSRSTRVILHPE